MSTWSQKEISKLKEVVEDSIYFEDVYNHFPDRSKSSIRYKIAQTSDKVLIRLQKENKEIKSSDGKKATLSQRYSSLISQTKKRALVCKITREDHQALLSLGKCAYCSQPIHSNGSALDRKDNTKGYLLENVVLCCKRF